MAGTVSITPLLRRLWPGAEETDVKSSEIAFAISHIFTNSLSPVQAGALLTALHFTNRDREADVLQLCAEEMRSAGVAVPEQEIRAVLAKDVHKVRRGGYQGGLCDIVGTGGDSHSTFNVSTTASIIASAYLRMAKHGNRASTSTSGSADLLMHVKPQAPNIMATTAARLPHLYERSNYGFLMAPVFHPGMKHVAHIRRELGWRTIFNLLGPLANPCESLIEARVIGVARTDLGPVFARTLLLMGVRKALVVCGREQLDEISCAGPTDCWIMGGRVGGGGTVEHVVLEPGDFGLGTHKLEDVSPGLKPDQNAEILVEILEGRMAVDHPIVEFVLTNVAALLAVSGCCDGEGPDAIAEQGPAGLRLKEGVRLAKKAIADGEVGRSWKRYIEATHES